MTGSEEFELVVFRGVVDGVAFWCIVERAIRVAGNMQVNMSPRTHTNIYRRSTIVHSYTATISAFRTTGLYVTNMSHGFYERTNSDDVRRVEWCVVSSVHVLHPPPHFPVAYLCSLHRNYSMYKLCDVILYTMSHHRFVFNHQHETKHTHTTLYILYIKQGGEKWFVISDI